MWKLTLFRWYIAQLDVLTIGAHMRLHTELEISELAPWARSVPRELLL